MLQATEQQPILQAAEATKQSTAISPPQEASSAVLQLPEDEELRSHRQSEGFASHGAAQHTAGQGVSPVIEGEIAACRDSRPQKLRASMCF